MTEDGKKGKIVDLSKWLDYMPNFKEFLDANKHNELKCEYLIPTVISDQIQNGEVKVSVLKTSAVWQGVTYREDKPRVVAEIKKLVDEGVYPEGLWK